MSIEDEIKEKMEDYDLVLVYPNNIVSKLAIFLTRLVFPSVKYNPLSPVFGYKGKIYGIWEEGNLADILVNHKYKKAYVLNRKLKYNPKRMDDIMEQFHKYDGVKLVIRYAITSVSGVLMNLLIFATFYKLFNINDLISLTIAIEVSIGITFFLNNNWVFSNRVYAKPLWRRFFGYHFILISGMLINIGTYYVLSLFRINYLLADFIGIIIAGIWSLYMVDVHVFFSQYQRSE